MESRVPVAANVLDGTLVVICSDGSVWRQAKDAKSWEELAPIPGSKTDAEDRN